MTTGYRNPPKGGRFKKGQSGDPNGRPRQAARQTSPAHLFRKVANEDIAIELDGDQVIMTRWEALLRQIHTLALNKDAGAARLLHQVRKQYPGSAAPGDKVIMVVSDQDMKL
ncbi:DUF5681 domain-containing protein [Bradyrhizobium sp. USDA 4454]